MLQQISAQIQDTIVEIANQPWFLPVCAAIAVLVIFFLLLQCFRCRDVRVLRDKNGQTLISRSALKDLVHLACERTGTPGKPSISFRPKRGRLNLRVRVKLYEGQRLTELREKLRRSLIRTFEESHGILIGEVDVIVAGFKKGGHSTASSYHDDNDDDQAGEETKYISIKPLTSPEPSPQAEADQDESAQDESDEPDSKNKPSDTGLRF